MDPVATGRRVSNRAKRMIEKEKCLEDSVPVKVARLFCVVDSRASMLWSRAIQMISGQELKFALNAANDTLPHKCQFGAMERPVRCMQVMWRKANPEPHLEPLQNSSGGLMSGMTVF